MAHWQTGGTLLSARSGAPIVIRVRVSALVEIEDRVNRIAQRRIGLYGRSVTVV